ncbi:helix-turn-helix domain-containing protein [Mangrovihabitans endophyticus]|uniref:Helix-turn-helix domain-containing protein n=1 Tax=Mangrovihabitans endophyticus TaxID=1751298 RepID=A0A8J3C6T1_9ACTN|nr:helix-turn-helix domain-containing protein [Mangrovihabitans endophyticus]GGL15865.1 hypothetical protein GCM10012284_58120 [Mangrovihabitans endophyticus]
MSLDETERAIQQLADTAAALTLDQRLRIAALLAQPSEPPLTAPAPEHREPQALVLTVEETAELLRIGRTTVYDLIKARELHSIMIGRLRRVRHCDVVNYLNGTGNRNG